MKQYSSLEIEIEPLLSSSVALRNHSDEIVKQRLPERPPATLLLASIGDCFAKTINQVSRQEQLAIWRSIENLLVNGTEEVKNAIATGLLETVLNEMSAGRLDWFSQVENMGNATLAYCKSWDAFCGVVYARPK